MALRGGQNLHHQVTKRLYLLAKARISPEGENPTPWTQPPLGLPYSPHRVLKGNFSPQTDGWGLLSTSFIYAEKTRAFASALPAASKTLLGCQSTERTVERIGFLSCLETHQSLSGSNEQIAIALGVDDYPPRVTAIEE